MSFVVRLLCCLSPLVAAAAPAPAPGPALAPSGKWVVDFSAAQCLASRPYGEATLLIKPSPLGNVVQVAVITGGKRSEPEQVAGEIHVDGAAPIATNLLVYSPPKGEDRVVSVANLPQERFAPLRQATRVRVRLEKKLDLTLALAQMKQVTDALDACIADLQNVWNVGESRTAALREPSRSTKHFIDLFNPGDYPATALQQNQSGDLGYVLLIDEKGALADCTIDRTSGVASLDAQSCYVFRARAKFKPAVGPDGKPAKSTITGRIRWVIPF